MALQKLRLFLSMQVYAWMGFPLALDLWDLVIEVFLTKQNQQTQDVKEPRGKPHKVSYI